MQPMILDIEAAIDMFKMLQENRNQINSTIITTITTLHHMNNNNNLARVIKLR